MYYHFDLRGVGAKEPVRLDHFQPLVHHGCRVDRDLASHHPIRVRAGLIRRHVVQSLQRQGAKRPAGRGQQYALHTMGAKVARKSRRQGLKDRVVLTIDRQHGRAAFPGRVQKYRPRHDQGFLVGEQNALSRARGTQHCGKARRADDGRDHGVGLRRAGHVHGGGLARQDLGGKPRIAHARPQFRRCPGVGQDDIARCVRTALCQHLFHAAPGHQGKHRESIRMTCNHVQRAFAYGSGGTQNCESTQARNFQAGRTKAKISIASGMAGISASMRSSTPP